jgi:hypothetical protein
MAEAMRLEGNPPDPGVTLSEIKAAMAAHNAGREEATFNEHYNAEHRLGTRLARSAIERVVRSKIGLVGSVRHTKVTMRDIVNSWPSLFGTHAPSQDGRAVEGNPLTRAESHAILMDARREEDLAAHLGVGAPLHDFTVGKSHARRQIVYAYGKGKTFTNPPSPGLVAEYRGPVRAAAHVDGFAENVAGCKTFHGHKPVRDHVLDFDDGKPELTERVVFALGDGHVVDPDTGKGLSQVYSVPFKNSSKAKRQFIHDATENGEAPPTLACDAQTGITMHLGNEVVTDYIRAKGRT